MSTTTTVLEGLPRKQEDPRSFYIHLSIYNIENVNAFVNLKASINVMSLSMFKRLGLDDMKETKIEVEQASRCLMKPLGVAENVLVEETGKDIFMIKTDVFSYEATIFTKFVEFNYLFHIEEDVFTCEIKEAIYRCLPIPDKERPWSNDSNMMQDDVDVIFPQPNYMDHGHAEESGNLLVDQNIQQEHTACDPLWLHDVRNWKEVDEAYNFNNLLQCHEDLFIRNNNEDNKVNGPTFDEWLSL
ncbi:reverse transcriptase domain-containing protein, partial [Tanacetum coccineum]